MSNRVPRNYDRWTLYVLLTVVLRLYNVYDAPPNTLFRSYVIPIYVIYTMIACSGLIPMTLLTDTSTMINTILYTSTLFAIYDTYYAIHQSLFDVFMRTCMASIIAMVITKWYRWCRVSCCCCCYTREETNE